MIEYPTQLALQDRGLARLDLSTVSVALGICKWFNVLHPPGARVMIHEPARTVTDIVLLYGTR